MGNVSPQHNSADGSDGEKKSHVSGNTLNTKKSVSTSRPNLSKIAKDNLQKTVDYQQKIQARVNFLKKEEKKYLQKIEKSKFEVEKNHKMKENKIETLKERIINERKEQQDLEQKIEQSR